MKKYLPDTAPWHCPTRPFRISREWLSRSIFEDLSGSLCRGLRWNEHMRRWCSLSLDLGSRLLRRSQFLCNSWDFWRWFDRSFEGSWWCMHVDPCRAWWCRFVSPLFLHATDRRLFYPQRKLQFCWGMKSPRLTIPQCRINRGKNWVFHSARGIRDWSFCRLRWCRFEECHRRRYSRGNRSVMDACDIALGVVWVDVLSLPIFRKDTCSVQLWRYLCRWLLGLIEGGLQPKWPVSLILSWAVNIQAISLG